MQFLRINNAYIKYRSYKKISLKKKHSSPNTTPEPPRPKQNKNEGKRKKKYINTNNK